jgi:hypothetical protein
LTPFRVVPASPDGKRKRFKTLERLNLCLQLDDGACGSRLVEYLLFGSFDLIVRRIL